MKSVYCPRNILTTQIKTVRPLSKDSNILLRQNWLKVAQNLFHVLVILCKFLLENIHSRFSRFRVIKTYWILLTSLIQMFEVRSNKQYTHVCVRACLYILRLADCPGVSVRNGKHVDTWLLMPSLLCLVIVLLKPKTHNYLESVSGFGF